MREREGEREGGRGERGGTTCCYNEREWNFDIAFCVHVHVCVCVCVCVELSCLERYSVVDCHRHCFSHTVCSKRQ